MEAKNAAPLKGRYRCASYGGMTISLFDPCPRGESTELIKSQQRN